LLNPLKKAGAQHLTAAEGDIEEQGGKVTAKGGQSVDFRTLAQAAPRRMDFTPYYDADVDVNPILDESTGKVIEHPPMKVNESTERLARYLVGKGGLVGLGHYTWDPTVQSWGATFAEVEVDMETGLVEVLRLVSVHDVGTVLYRTGAEAQVHGGVMMGLGFGMREMLESDPNTFIPLQPNYLGLGAPTVLDYPEIVPILVEAPVKAGPYGAKGLGENPLFGPPPAIGNAIHNATGVRIDHIPYDWHNVYEALKNASRLSA
jgi:CO/xanthine dehydrogenase Mo-binding subunit